MVSVDFFLLWLGTKSDRGRVGIAMTTVDDAIESLSMMFELYDKDTLVAVLEANEGHLERTIDALLAMQTDNPSTAPATAVLPTEATTLASFPPPPSTAQTLHRSRAVLPDDFLRVPTGAASDQETQDRMLAEMLQSEYFRQEIAADQDISNYIGVDGRRYRVPPPAVPEKSAYDVANETIVAVGERLSDMRTSVKNKISEMYARFQASRQPSDPSHRPLMALSDDESDESYHSRIHDGPSSGELTRRRSSHASSPRHHTVTGGVCSHSKRD
ncbi:hypothetical protein H310_03767 [Aphanomyces invadans]|uniref:CUE domain-containing protein n=1 Tax=Aphanomyces invadans TaxID=157072 RepID=A0A024UIS0_9STRA|nr:hypothetical protein H310_03767 [Aphanomyces invadans]ETW06194.1 hypothetical protein H310_03767 [Aphanomyces invadans]|eukprot:XP_008865971.1 hypothetical protein H310_03767 [Aphanomyces invadans]